jgi:hypothetical protein
VSDDMPPASLIAIVAAAAASWRWYEMTGSNSGFGA